MKCHLALILLLSFLLMPVAVFGTSQTICWNSGIPAGWIQVDFYTNYATCGNGTGSGGATLTNNVWVIDSYYDKAVGSSMAVCALQGTPSGWATQYYFTTSGQCPYTSTVTNNVKVILRLR